MVNLHTYKASEGELKTSYLDQSNYAIQVIDNMQQMIMKKYPVELSNKNV